MSRPETTLTQCGPINMGQDCRSSPVATNGGSKLVTRSVMNGTQPSPFGNNSRSAADSELLRDHFGQHRPHHRPPVLLQRIDHD